jgi:hypothetical protein
MNKPVELLEFKAMGFLQLLAKHFLMMKNANTPVKMDPKNIEAITTPTKSAVFKMMKFDFFAEK